MMVFKGRTFPSNSLKAVFQNVKGLRVPSDSHLFYTKPDIWQ